MKTEQNEDVIQRLDYIIEYMEEGPASFEDDIKTLKDVKNLIEELQHKNKLQAYEIETLKLYCPNIKTQPVVDTLPRFWGFIIVIMAVLSMLCTVLSLII